MERCAGPGTNRFSYCIQEPRAKAGLETVTEKERRAFETMLQSI